MRRLLIAVAACGPSAARRPIGNPAPAERAPPLSVRVVVDGDGTPLDSMAIGGDHLWWMADGDLWRATKDGRDAVDVATFEGDHDERAIAALAADGEVVFGAGKDVWTFDSALHVLVAGADAWQIAIDADTVFYSTRDTIAAVPRAGGDPATLASGDDVFEANSLATDGRYVYWTQEDSGPHTIPVSPGAIRRVPVSGGAVQVVVTGIAPEGLAVIDDRVYWPDERAGAIVSAATSGGRAEVALGGSGSAIAGDGHGVVALADGGEIVEHTASGPPLVRAFIWPGLTSGDATPEVAVDDDAVFVLDTAEDRILLSDRRISSITVVAAADGWIADVASEGARRDYLDVGEISHLMSVPVTGGAPTELARVGGHPVALAAGDGRIGWIDDAGEIALLGGPTVDVGHAISAATIDRGALVWLDGGDVVALPIAGGERRRLYASTAVPCARNCQLAPPGRIAHAGDRIVAGGGRLAQVVAIADSGTTRLIDAPVSDFAVTGDGVAAWVKDRGVVLAPRGRVLLSDDDDATVIAADAAGVWVNREGDRPALDHIGFADGRADVHLDAVTAGNAIPTSDALYFTIAGGSLLLRLAR